MKKLVAKTLGGKEYFHSREFAFFASTNADRIASALNRAEYQIKTSEKWHVYDFDIGMEMYVSRRIFISKSGEIKVANLY